MGFLDTLREHTLAVTIASVVILLVVLAIVGASILIPAAIQFFQEQQASAGDVTFSEAENGTVVTIRVTAMNKSDYMNVVVNGGTDEPRPGVAVREATNVTATPADNVGMADPDDPMDGPPDVDADSVGDVVTVSGLRSGDTIHVIGVRTDGDSTTRVLFRSYNV